jgi:hypothetical protein
LPFRRQKPFALQKRRGDHLVSKKIPRPLNWSMRNNKKQNESSVPLTAGCKLMHKGA